MILPTPVIASNNLVNSSGLGGARFLSDQRTAFCADFRKFFKSVVRQRVLLINKGKSFKNLDQMQNIIDKLTPLLSVNYNDLGAARFIIKRHPQLRRLIPSQAKARFRQLDELLTKADQVLNPQIF